MEQRRLSLDVRAIAIALALIVAALALWVCAQVVLLAFGAAIFATLLKGSANLLTKWLKVPKAWSLPLAILLIFGLLVGFGVLFGMQVAAELNGLVENLPQLIDSAGERVGLQGLGDQIGKLASQLLHRQGTFVSIADYTTNALGILGNTLFVVVGGIFLAIDIDRYREGLLLLIPRPHREKWRQVLYDMARVLQLWLLGQLVAMLVVGIVTTIGLYWLGVPSALASGPARCTARVHPVPRPVPRLWRSACAIAHRQLLDGPVGQCSVPRHPAGREQPAHPRDPAKNH